MRRREESDAPAIGVDGAVPLLSRGIGLDEQPMWRLEHEIRQRSRPRSQICEVAAH
jgi:hypothetical protein